MPHIATGIIYLNINLLAPSLASQAFAGVEALAEVIGMPEVTLEADTLHEVALVPRERVKSGVK